MKCVRITLIEGDELGASFTAPLEEPFSLPCLFDGAEPPRSYRFELVKMSRKDYDAMPEFDGF